MVYTEKQVAALASHTFAHLVVSHEDHVLRLTLNRPDKKNALNPVLMRELAFALAYARYTPTVRAITVRGNGDVFCAGADLKAFAGAAQAPTSSTIPEPAGEILLGELFVQAHKPSIAVVQGPAYAGAHLMLCGCNYVVATPAVTFSLPEARRGLFPMQVLAGLLQIMPPRQALDYCLRARTLSAEEAQALGLVSYIKTPEEIEDFVQSIEDEICALSPTALRMGLAAYDALRAMPLSQSHAFLKGMLDELIQSEDAREGLAAFQEKRPPVWRGR